MILLGSELGQHATSMDYIVYSTVFLRLSRLSSVQLAWIHLGYLCHGDLGSFFRRWLFRAGASAKNGGAQPEVASEQMGTQRWRENP